MESKTPATEPRKAGRPKKHATAADRVNHYRRQKKAEGQRLDVFICTKASWRLAALAKSWSCSPGKVIERLILEADEKYSDILFPVTE